MSSDADKTARLNELLNAAWREYRGEITGRIEAVRLAADLAHKGSLNEADRAAANSAAHKLAGVLGTFGLRDASHAALEIEKLLVPGPELSSTQLAAFESLLHLIDTAVAGKDRAQPTH